MALAVVASLVVTCAICYGILQLMMYHTRRRRMYKLASKFDGPPVLPLIGNAHQLIGSGEDILSKLNKFATEYPSPWRLWIGPYLLIGITEPEQVKAICMSPKTLGKGPVVNFFTQLVGTGLFTAPVSKWKVHRKLIQPTFNTKILDTFVEVFAAQAEVFSNIIEENLDGCEFEILDLISRCSLDMICETVVDFKIGAQTNKNVKFAEAEEQLLAGSTKRFFSIWLYPDMIYYRTQLGRDARKCIKYIFDFTDNVVEKKKNKISKCNSPQTTAENENEAGESRIPRKALVDHLMTLPQGGKTLSDVELREEVITFVVAGHDTTAYAMSYVILMLVSNPEVQEKVYEELREIYGDYSVEERPVTSKDLSRMKYLERVIKETLRLFPVVSFFVRDVSEDIEIGDHTLPKGSTALVGIMSIHRNDKYWPDPLKFDPDRFLPEEVAKRHPYAFIAFSGGPRNCVGLVYAQMAIKTLVATVLRRYVLKMDNIVPAKDVKLKFESIVKPVDPIKVKITKRISTNE